MAFLKIVVILFSVVTIGAACSCMPIHPQGHFCRAQFVIRGKILSGPVEEVPDDLVPRGIPRPFLAYQVYTLRITKTYKGSAAIRNTGGLRPYGKRGRTYSIKIYTPSKLNSCSVKMTKGKVYVIAGYIGRKKLSISQCNFKKEWKKITKKQRSGFARKYHRSCDCWHHLCYGDCSSETPRMACALDISRNPANECRDKYQYCQLSRNGRSCAWTMNSLYKACVRRIP